MEKAHYKPQNGTIGSDQPCRFSLLDGTGSANSYATNQFFTTKANSSYQKQSFLPVCHIFEPGLDSETSIVVQQPWYPFPGQHVRADWASKNFQDSRKQLLSPRVFQGICGDSQSWTFLHQQNVIRYNLSWKADPHSLETDAFQTNSKIQGLLYAFLPFSMLGKVLLKVKKEEVDVVLITTSWPAQPCSTTLVQSGSRIICNQTSASTSVKQHLS